MAEIIYQDEYVTVFNKTQTEDSEALAHENGLFPVHRLDRTTGGLLLMANTSSAAAKLSAQMADGRFCKTYHTVVEGKVETETGRLENLLYHDRIKNKTYVVDRMRNGVKKAVLEYKVEKYSESFTSLSVKLLTGRTHQIRSQFAHIGHPVKNDSRYGSKSKGDICLWCVEIHFIHPKTNKEMSFKISKVL